MRKEQLEGRSDEFEGVQNVPQLIVSQVQMKKREAEKDREKEKSCRSVQRKDGRKTDKREFKEEHQPGRSKQCVENLGEKMEEEVLEKCEVEEIKRGACKGRDELSEWRIIQRAKKYQPRKWDEDC